MANETLKPVRGADGLFMNSRGQYVIKTSAKSMKTGKMVYGKRTLKPDAAKDEALQTLGEVKAELRSGSKKVVPAVEIPTLAAYVPLWGKRRLTRGAWNADGGTAEITGWRLDQYVIPYLGDHLIDRIDYADLQRWLDIMSSSGLAVNTIKATYGHVRCLIKDGRLDHGLPPLPLFPPPPRAARSGEAPLTWENFEDEEGAALTMHELQAFLHEAKKQSPNGWYPFCILGFASGARFSELAAVQAHDLDLEPEVGVWLVRRHLITSRMAAAPGVKWNKRGMVKLLDSESTRLLRPFLADKTGDALAFPSDQSGYQYRSNVGLNMFIVQVAQAAGIKTPGLTSKVFRRTFVTLSHLDTMALAMAQAQAGHADPKTTQVYNKPSVAARREHAKKMAGVLHVVEGGAGEEKPPKTGIK